jgi:transcriptional regulator with XRE-family HTH domain
MANTVQPKSKTLSELSQRIRKARQEARLSQSALGKLIGVSDKSVSSYEQGRSTPPVNKLKKIAEFTNHPLTYFTQEDNDDATITSKLLAIEHEFQEIKKLLKEAGK